MTGVTHVLDTSALIAYYLKENGWEIVHQLILMPLACHVSVR